MSRSAPDPIEALGQFLDASVSEFRSLFLEDSALSHWRHNEGTRTCMTTLKHLARGLKESATRFGLLMKTSPNAEATESVCREIYDIFQQLNSCVVLIAKIGLAQPLRKKAASRITSLYRSFSELLGAAGGNDRRDLNPLVGVVWTECDGIGSLEEENREVKALVSRQKEILQSHKQSSVQAYNGATKIWCRTLSDVTREFTEIMGLPERNNDEVSKESSTDCEEETRKASDADLAEEDGLFIGDDDEVGYTQTERPHVQRMLGIFKLCRIMFKNSFSIRKSLLDNDEEAAASPVLLDWAASIHTSMEGIAKQSEDAAVTLYPPLDIKNVLSETRVMAKLLYDFADLCIRVEDSLDASDDDGRVHSGTEEDQTISEAPTSRQCLISQNRIEDSLITTITAVKAKLEPLIRRP